LTKCAVERHGDATALGRRILTNCAKSGTTLSPYRIDTMDSLCFPNGAQIEMSTRLSVRDQEKNPQAELP
jgi:hypothetical protein